MGLTGPFRLRELLLDRTGQNVTVAVPTGVLHPFAGSSAPTGYLLCDGSAVSRTTYATLFATISTTYGVGDGSTTFNLPDMRGRMPIGPNSDSTAANTATRSVGAKGGDTRMQTHTHTQNSHNHTQDSHNHAISIDGSLQWGQQPDANGAGWSVNADTYTGGVLRAVRASPTTATNQATTATNQNTGSGSSENMPPFVVTNYIIKT